MTPAEKNAEIAKLDSVTFQDGIYLSSDGSPFDEYWLWIYEIGVGFTYNLDDPTGSGLFELAPDGTPDDLSDYISDGTGEDLELVLANYSWAMLP